MLVNRRVPCFDGSSAVNVNVNVSGDSKLIVKFAISASWVAGWVFLLGFFYRYRCILCVCVCECLCRNIYIFAFAWQAIVSKNIVRF